MNLDDKFEEGTHTIEFTLKGTVKVENGDDLTLYEAIDIISLGGYLMDWSVDGQ